MTTVATGQVLLAGTPPAGLAASFAALHIVSLACAGSIDYAGPSRNLRYRSPHVAFRPCKSVSVLIASFRSSIPSPPVPLFYASRCTSRCSTQNSGPSGSLLLSRRTLSFPASCRFSPAHYIGDLALVEFGGLVKISGLPIIPSARPGASTLGLGRLTPDCSSQAA